MKKLKRFSAILLVVCMLFAVACGTDSTNNSDTPPSSNTQSPSQNTTTPSPQETATASGFEEGNKEGTNFAEHIDVIVNQDFVVLNTLLPAGNTMVGTWAGGIVHDRLISHPEPGVFEPSLAKSWETDDYKTWRFFLRDDVTFHNGDHFTAEDVKFTIDLALATPGTIAFNRYTQVESVEVIDPYTVDVILKAPNVDIFFEFANHGGGSILNKRSYEENGEIGRAHV